MMDTVDNLIFQFIMDRSQSSMRSMMGMASQIQHTVLYMQEIKIQSQSLATVRLIDPNPRVMTQIIGSNLCEYDLICFQEKKNPREKLEIVVSSLVHILLSRIDIRLLRTRHRLLAR